jgi:DNA polymerase-3 subunit gamma/tau
MRGKLMPLQHVYRPKDFDEFIGNTEIINSLKILLERKQDIPHCFLFTGPSGIGKTSLARILKDKFGCDPLDYIEIDASDDRGIDAMRSLKERVKHMPLSGKSIVVLLDECHSLTSASAESLLKLLEEPPPYVFFILCTTEDNFKPTFKRRLHCYDLKPVPFRLLQKYIETIYAKEGIDLTDEDRKIINRIVEIADGSPGIALKLLDQIIDLGDYEQAMAILESDIGSFETSVAEICQILIKAQPDSWGDIVKKMKGVNGNFEEFRQKIVSYLGGALVRSGSERIANLMNVLIDPITKDNGKAGLLLLLFTASKI